MPLTLRSFARSEVGLIREGNEDSAYAGANLVAVADGMGGHAAGEVASSITIDTLSNVDVPATAASLDDARAVLPQAVRLANQRIRAVVEEHPQLEGMGTTATAAVWTGSLLVVAHVGDSRAYLLHRGELHQITHDHTYVQALVDEGRLSVDDVATHPARSYILRALGTGNDVEVDLFTVEVEAGDRLLLCSDGLSGFVSDAEIGKVLLTIPDREAAVARLIELTYAAGAADNVTCVLADVAEASTEPRIDDTAEAYIVGAAADGAVDDETRAYRLAASEAVNRNDDERQVDLEALRYAPQEPSRMRWVWRGLAVAVGAAVIWAVTSWAYGWTQRQYFVSTANGDVAIYKGVDQELGPVDLSSLYQRVDDLPVAALSAVNQGQLQDTIAADDLDDARRVVERLRIAACGNAIGTPTPTVSPTPTPTTPTPTTPAATTPPPAPGAVPAPAPAPTPTPTPTPAPTLPNGLDCSEVAP